MWIIIIEIMAESQWGTRAERLLLAYFQIEWVQTVNLILYFIVEIALFIFLTLLPIKIAYGWLLKQVDHFHTIVDSSAVVIFSAHVYLYLNYKLGKLVRNPEIQKKLLFQNKVVKMKWCNLVTLELVYDLLCLFVSIAVLVLDSTSLVARLLQLFYLPKIYKIKLFHDRFQNYIIGTSFYVVYNVFYGLFILIILVSYVGCIFYQIDLSLYHSNYEYQNLLWINYSAWNDIINSDFGVQLVYAIYWSVGTASASAYGDISASAPPDVVFNIICLYFEGFLFAFYLSRIHSLPATMSEKENELLELFQKFQEHSDEIKAQGEIISKQLYFKILCSIQYQQSRQKSLTEIETILPEDYIVEIKEHIFKGLISRNPMNLWSSQSLKNALCLKISEIVVEVGEELYEYATVQYNDLLYLKSGKIQYYLELDHHSQFETELEEDSLFNTFSFVTNLKLLNLRAKLRTYSILYVLKRKDYRQLLTCQDFIHFNELFEDMIAFENLQGNREPIGLYSLQLAARSSDVMLMNPLRNMEYIIQILDRKDGSNSQKRKWTRRRQISTRKTVGLGRKSKVSVGVQCSEEVSNQIDKVMIVQSI